MHALHPSTRPLLRHNPPTHVRTRSHTPPHTRAPARTTRPPLPRATRTTCSRVGGGAAEGWRTASRRLHALHSSHGTLPRRSAGGAPAGRTHASPPRGREPTRRRFGPGRSAAAWPQARLRAATCTALRRRDRGWRRVPRPTWRSGGDVAIREARGVPVWGARELGRGGALAHRRSLSVDAALNKLRAHPRSRSFSRRRRHNLHSAFLSAARTRVFRSHSR